MQRADIGFVEDVEVEVDGGPAVDGVEGGLRVFAEQVGILRVILRRSAMDRSVILRPGRKQAPDRVSRRIQLLAGALRAACERLCRTVARIADGFDAAQRIASVVVGRHLPLIVAVHHPDFRAGHRLTV